MGKSTKFAVVHNSPSDSESQREKFMRAARELGCTDDEQAFDDKLRRVAKIKQPESAPKKSGG